MSVSRVSSRQAWLLKMLAIVCLLFQIGVGQNDGEVRLVSTRPGYGITRVEIYHSGSNSWGPVCAENWALRESLVICIQQGFRFVSGFYRESVGVVTAVRLADVKCEGNEGSLLDCQHSQFGVSRECTAGVVTLRCNDEQVGTVILRGGESFSEGRVEIRFEFGNDTIIYTICDDGWDLEDAQVVCTGEDRTPYDSALQAVGGSYFGEYPDAWTDQRFDGFLTSGVQCNSSYSNMLKCPNSGWFPKNCPSGKNAGAICKRFNEKYRVDVALFAGSSQFNGAVKVNQPASNQPAGSICDSNYGWSLSEGDVVCRSLGYGYALDVSRVNTTWKPALTNVRCDGNEESLTQCFRGGTCYQNGKLATTVNCSGPVAADHNPLQITNGLGMRSDRGLLRIYRDGRWGTICNKSWTMANAEVVCRQLGYKSVVTYFDSWTGRGPIFLSNVRCDGSEQQLNQCEHDGLGIHDNCTHVMDVALQCGAASKIAVNGIMMGMIIMAALIGKE